MAMQEEATQRVREMQRRAQITAQRAQEELDQKNTARKPAQTAMPAPQTQHSEKRDQPRELPLEPERTPPEERQEVDAGRLAFLDDGPRQAPPATGKPHQPKHISLPVDFIQEKQGPPATGETLTAPSGDALVRSGPHGTEPEPDKKPSLNLLEGGSDQSLLLALMLLLNGEGTDELLLLALLYMMM